MDFLCPRCGAPLYLDAVRPGEHVQCGVCLRAFPVAEAVSNAEVVIDMGGADGPRDDAMPRNIMAMGRGPDLNVRYYRRRYQWDGCCGCNGCGCLIVLLLLLFLLFGCFGAAVAEGPNEADTKVLLFSYFMGNGEEGLFLAHSEDGYSWTALNPERPLLRPMLGDRLMRDPCIYFGPDRRFHMVWTTGWDDQGIGIAHSEDLIRWSEQRWLPVMEHEPNARNCWAPEIFYDAARGHYMIFWATTIPGRFPETDPTGVEPQDHGNHRVYYVTTKDFTEYSETRLLYDGGFNVIDATMIRHDNRYAMFVKDETLYPNPKKNIRVVTAPFPTGPFGPASPPITRDWVEGPSLLRVKDQWLLYFDEYTRARYGAVASQDLMEWADVSSQIRFPTGARHGTAFRAPEAVLTRLRRFLSAADTPDIER